jgi:hypothetical protein
MLSFSGFTMIPLTYLLRGAIYEFDKALTRNP